MKVVLIVVSLFVMNLSFSQNKASNKISDKEGKSADYRAQLSSALKNASLSQNIVAYKIYDKEGNETNYQTMLNSVVESDIVFFGELHNNAISHWLQYELSADIYVIKTDQLVLAAEMFETDNQVIMDEYLSGIIPQNKFEEEMRMWKNYKTDYKPLVELAKTNGLKFIASNVPRRYASIVSKGGFEVLRNYQMKLKSLFLNYQFLTIRR